jgi:Tol biopolymer transport system component
MIAFQSEASDLVPGDSNGVSDVFALRRAEPYSTSGSPWHPGRVLLVSRGMAGQPANGPSFGASVGGDYRHRPRCVAFVSAASNLVRGDTNGVPDAFIWWARSGAVQRVSVASGGRQANGPSDAVSVSGDCSRVAFSSSATNLALRRSRRLAWRSAVTGSPSGTQVYVRFLGRGRDRAFRGLTMLASVSGSGRPANGDSTDPVLAASGRWLAFTSAATDLSGADPGAGPDVYVRSLGRRFRHFRHGHAAQSIVLGTRLVSATASGAAGNGASSAPAISDDGRYVAYQTLASNLVAGDGNGVSDVVLADLSSSPPRQVAVSRTPAGFGNGPSSAPSVTSSGHFVAFQSDASNLKMRPDLLSDTNGVCDMLVGLIALGSSSVESLTSTDHFARGPSQRPSISSHGNYIAFQSNAALMDANHPNPGVEAIYLRYLGPK